MLKADQVSSVAVVFLALFKQEGLNDKIKNFSENHLYSHPAPELDSLSPSSAEGHACPLPYAKPWQAAHPYSTSGSLHPGVRNPRSFSFLPVRNLVATSSLNTC